MEPKYALRVHSNALVLHAYMNGKCVGNQIMKDNKFDYRFEKKVNLVHGTNHISLLSVSVGLQVRSETLLECVILFCPKFIFEN